MVLWQIPGIEVIINMDYETLEMLKYIIKNIKDGRGICQMSNAQLAQDMLPYVEKKFPEVKLINCGTNHQWFVINTKAKKKLLKNLENSKEKIQQELEDVEKAIYSVSQSIELEKRD